MNYLSSVYQSLTPWITPPTNESSDQQEILNQSNLSNSQNDEIPLHTWSHLSTAEERKSEDQEMPLNSDAGQKNYEGTALEVNRTMQYSWWNLVTAAASQMMTKGSQLVVDTASNYSHQLLQSYKTQYEVQKPIIEAKSKLIMRSKLREEQFIDLYDWVKTTFIRSAKQKIKENFTEGTVANYVVQYQSMILDIFEISLARGFATFADQIKKHKDEIPNYDQQSFLANIFFLTAKKAFENIDEKKLKELDSIEYQTIEAKVKFLTNKLFPDVNIKIKLPDNSEKTIKQLIQDYIKILDSSFDKRNKIALLLFPSEQQHHLSDEKEFLNLLDQLNTRDKELYKIFYQVTNNILFLFFPNKFNDIKLPVIFGGKFLEVLYNGFIHDNIVAFLQDNYQTFKDNSIEKSEILKHLETISGSKFIGSLGQALTKDVLNLLPLALNSYEEIAYEIFIELSNDENPDLAQVDKFTQNIQELANRQKDKNITNKALIKAYIDAVGIKSDALMNKVLKDKISKIGAKQKISHVIKSTDEILEIIQTKVDLTPEMVELLQEEFNNLIQDPTRYDVLKNFLNDKIENVILNILIKVAEKNPSSVGNQKDTLVILTERFLEIILRKYLEAAEKSSEEFGKEIVQSLLEEVLGIYSAKDFEGLPPFIQDKVFELLKSNLSEFAANLHAHIKLYGNNSEKVMEASKNLKKFGLNSVEKKSYVEILAHDLSYFTTVAISDMLSKKIGSNVKGSTLISKNLEMTLEGYARDHLQVASTLLVYTKGLQFKSILDEQINKIAGNEALKQQSSDVLGNLFSVGFDRALEKVASFEEEKGEKFNQKLMANLFNVAALHIFNLHAAKDSARAAGQTQIRHQDFIAVAGDQLHPALIKKAVTYEASIRRIQEKLSAVSTLQWNQQRELQLGFQFALLTKSEGESKITLTVEDIINTIDLVFDNSLTNEQKDLLRSSDDQGLTIKDSIRNEAYAPEIQKNEEAYEVGSKIVLKMLFPNGKQDLDFVPVELRTLVWEKFNKTLFPMLLALITDQVLKPATIDKIVLSSLETIRDSLKPLDAWTPESLLAHYHKDKESFSLKSGKNIEDILGEITGDKLLEEAKKGNLILKPAVLEKEDPSQAELNEAAGNLVSQILKVVELPRLIKLVPGFKESLFDPKTGKVSPALMKTLGASLRQQFNGTFIRDKLQSSLAAAVKRDETGSYALNPDSPLTDPASVKANIKKVSREIVDESLAYFIRETWKTLQASFDELISQVFGKIGSKIKQGLDAIFGFIFFKIIGAFLSFICSPIKGFAKNRMYDLIMLDKNLQVLLNLVTDVPSEQPIESEHAIYQEDLVFKLSAILKQTVEEALNQPILGS